MALTREPRAWRIPAAMATALAGVLTLASTLSPNTSTRERLLTHVEPLWAQSIAHAAAAVGGVALLAVSLGVLRGRRRSAHAAVAVLCVLVIVHAAKGLDYEEALIALLLAVLLRRGAAPTRPAFAALLAVAAVAGAYAITLTILLLAGRPPGVEGALGGAGRSLWAGARLTSLDPSLRLVAHIALGCALCALAGVARALMAPRRAEDGHDRADHARAARIVARWGNDSIAPFVLRADKAFFFGHGAVLAYRTLRETAVVSGDPIGPAGSHGPLLQDFLAFARRREWDVAVSGASAAHLAAYRALGLGVLQIGCEAVVDPAAFTLAGRAGRTVRKAVGRVTRHGWSVELVPSGGLTPALAAEIDAVERAWRAANPRLYGFAMASDRLWGASEDARDVYVLARSPAGEVRAFQRYVPFVGGLSLDAMRRLDDEPNGIADALVATALEHARGLGLGAVSLNFAGFAHVMAAETIGVRSRPVVRLGLRAVRGPFKLDRLVRFAQKFGPEWRPRYVVYTSPGRLPLVALRVLQSEAYVRPPRSRLRTDAWRPRPVPAPAEPSAAR